MIKIILISAMKGITEDHQNITKDYESLFYSMKDQCKKNSHSNSSVAITYLSRNGLCRKNKKIPADSTYKYFQVLEFNITCKSTHELKECYYSSANKNKK